MVSFEYGSDTEDEDDTDLPGSFTYTLPTLLLSCASVIYLL